MIEARTKTVYYSSRKNRHYFSLAAAVEAEASKAIEERYPSESSEHDELGRCTNPGWWWKNEIEKSYILLRRVKRLVKANYLKSLEQGAD